MVLSSCRALVSPLHEVVLHLGQLAREIRPGGQDLDIAGGGARRGNAISLLVLNGCDAALEKQIGVIRKEQRLGDLLADQLRILQRRSAQPIRRSR